MALPGVWNRLTAGIFGAGIGIASADAIEPLIEPAKQEAWAKNTFKVVPLAEAARLRAQGQIEDGQLEDEAARQGYNMERALATVQALLTAPGVPELLTLLRRGEIDQDGFEHGLRKAQLEPQWDDALKALETVLLPVADLAVMVQRGIVANDDLLPVGPPEQVGVVPPMPMIGVDPVDEAAKQGWTKDRLAGLARIIGLPASPDLAARMFFRGIIEKPDFFRAISEGNTRNEWAPVLLEGFREILTAHDYAELQLRGFLTRDQRLDGTNKHGMSEADSDLLYDVLGRSIPVHQIETGLARGGTYNGDFSAIPEAYLSSLRRGNLRPEYYSLAYANRYGYPSAFFIRLLLQQGDISAAEGEKIFLEIGWRPDLAKKVADSLAASPTTAVDPNVKKAQTQLWTATHRSYIAEESGTAEARQRLDTLGIPAADQDAILGLWDAERSLIRAQLSPADVRKALDKGVTNPATGAPWTLADATQALLDRGWDKQDAATYLTTPTGQGS